MAGKQIGKLSIKVLPDTTTFKEELKAKLEQIEKTMKFRLEVEALTDKAELTLARFRTLESAKRIQVQVAAETAEAKLKLDEIARSRALSIKVAASTSVAKTQLAVLSRDRYVTMYATVNKTSLANVSTVLARLSGFRVAHEVLTDVREAVQNIDTSVPKIARWALGLSALTSSILTSSAGLVTLTGDILKMANTAFVLPAAFTGAAVGIITLAMALKDSKTELAQFAPAMHELQNSISTEFWAKAKAPFVDLVNSVLPSARDGFAQTSSAIGTQMGALSAAFQKTLGGGVLDAMFLRLRQTIDTVTTGSTGFAEAITTIGTVGSNYLPQLAAWVVKISDQFNAWIQNVAASGELDKFIQDGILQMQLFGSSIADIVRIFKGIDRAATAAGGGGLATFAENMRGAAAAINAPGFQAALTTILSGANTAMAGLGGGILSFGGMLQALAPQIGAVLGIAGDSIGGLLTAVSDAMNQPAFRVGLVDFFTGIQSGVAALGPAMVPLFGFIGQLGTTIGALAAVIGPVLASLKITFAPLFDAVLAAITPLIPILGKVLTDTINGLGPTVQALTGFITDNVGIIQFAVLAFGGLGLAIKAVSFVSMIAGWVLNTAAMVASKVETLAIMGLYAKEFVVNMAKAAAGLAVSTAKWVANTAAQVASKAIVLGGAIAMGVATAAQWLWNASMTANPIGIIVLAIVALVASIIWIATQTTIFQDVWQAMSDFVVAAWNNTVAFINTAITALVATFTIIGATIAAVWNALWAGISAVVGFVWAVIVGVVTAYINMVIAVVTAVGATIAAVWNGLWAGISAVVMAVWAGIVGFVTGYINMVLEIIRVVMGVVASVWNGMWSGLSDTVASVWDGIKGVIDGMVSGISDAIGGIGDAVGGIKDTIMGAISGAGTWLLDSGKSIIQGLIDGIDDMIGGAKNAAKGVMDAIANFFPHSPAPEGPFSGKGWTLYSGQAMAEGLSDGMDSRVSVVRKSALAMMTAASGVARVGVDAAVAGIPTGSAAGYGDQITVMGNVGYDPAAIAAEIALKKRQAAMVSGLSRVGVA